MPAIMPDDDIGLAFDMHGCPNRCRHCWLGQASDGRMTEDDARWVVAQFRAFRRPGESQPPWSGVRMLTWAREPDHSPDYRRLYALEQELSGLPSQRPDYEVLSVWRLARDPIGPSGNSGFEHANWVPHLHFEMQWGESEEALLRTLRSPWYDVSYSTLAFRVNPLPYLFQWFEEYLATEDD